MSKQDELKVQTCVLKVDIHCACVGCEKKVKKLLQKVYGVYSVSVDAEQGKVIVTGNNVDPYKLIQKLNKSGKHAELSGGAGQRGGKDNKSQKGEKKQKKGGDRRGGGQAAQFQNEGAKNHKFDAGDGGFDEFVDDEEFHGEGDDEAFSLHIHSKKMMSVMGNDGSMNKTKGNISMKAKRGDYLPMQKKGKGGNSELRSGGGVIRRFLGCGGKSKKGGEGEADTDGGGGVNNNGNEEKMSRGGKLEGHHHDRNDRMGNDFKDFEMSVSGKGGTRSKSKNAHSGEGSMGEIGPMSQGGSMGPILVGDYLGMHGMYGWPHPYTGYMPYPYMGYMPHPSMSYVQPPPMPCHPLADPVTHIFSDENTQSCIIM